MKLQKHTISNLLYEFEGVSNVSLQALPAPRGLCCLFDAAGQLSVHGAGEQGVLHLGGG